MIICTKKEKRGGLMNKSYSYLLPLFNEECAINGDYFIILRNVYTKYNDNEGYFVLCYENMDNDNFTEYISRLHENHLFLESYIEGNLLYIVFKFPEEFRHEYNCYLSGKFSKFRESSKLKIIAYVLSVHKNNSAEGIRKVLYKDKALRESLELSLDIKINDEDELSSTPNSISETCYNDDSKIKI